MKQYKRIKAQHQEAVLLFGMGVFYETFFEDAEVLSELFGSKIVYKDYGYDKPVPMCGVPMKAIPSYTKRLVENGYQVAICNQVKGKTSAEGLVHREVVQVVGESTAKRDLSNSRAVMREEVKAKADKPQAVATEKPKTKRLKAEKLKTDEGKKTQKVRYDAGEYIVHLLRQVNLYETTPADALNLLYELQKICEEYK